MTNAKPMNTSELVDFLNSLLEAERAGAKCARVFHQDHGEGDAGPLIDTVYHDEAWCCGMLSRHITAIGGKPTEVTGDFLEKAVAKEGLDARLAFLNKGQGWVVRKLEEAIPRISNPALRDDLDDMLVRHRVNIDDCARFLETRA